MIIFSNEFIELIEDHGNVFLKVLKIGFPVKDFQAILLHHPRIKVTNFPLIISILYKETQQPLEIGKYLPSIEIEIALDKMTALIYINETKDKIQENQNHIKQQIQLLLAEKNINHGLIPIDLSSVETGKAIIVAKGTAPIKGDDAKVEYLEIPKRKPVIREDGRADYLDMNFITEIHEGDWLGEKIPAKGGTSGKNIFGEVISAPTGRDIPLKYDKKTAIEVEEDDKIILRAKNNGVVEHRQGLLSVSPHLPIDGDVGYETGNIQFNGSVSIHGTVQNGFSVIATGDISIDSLEGINGAKLIKSTGGDIFIRGGVFGLSKTIIEAKNNIFAKHVNEATLIAGNDIYIGSYVLGSNLSANKIIVDERNGKIIGGKSVAKDSIITAISGNRMERRTELIIEGLMKQEIHVAIQEKAQLLKTLNDEIIKITSQLNNMQHLKDRLNEKQLAAFHQITQLVEQKKQNAEVLDFEIKELLNQFRKDVIEEITVRKEAHPGTYIQIGRKSSLLYKMTNGTFKLENGELNV